MRRAIVVANERAEHQQSFGGAFAEGLRRHGWRVTVSKMPASCDLLCIWGVRHQHWIADQKRAGGEVCILERGYIDRFRWTSVSFGGGLNNRGVFRGPFHDGSRWERHFGDSMKPWRQKPGGVALIMGQVAGDMAVRNVGIDDWYRTATGAYRAAGFQTRFRPHPGVPGTVYPNRPPVRPLQADLADAACVVTWSSNSGVDAVLAGVPTVALDEGSMAYAVSGHTLGEMPPAPDRTAWAHRLAWCQYTRDELQSGFAWDAMEAACATAA